MVQDQKLDEKAIFNAALALESSAARQEYLESACGADRELFQRVSELLELQAESPSFMEAPAADILATLAMSAPTARVGKSIGRYRLRELLGEGGMGSVYVAEQEKPVRRKVALKIIKPGMDSREVIARFEAERQALALMDHPNIARVLDAGTTDQGLPYFVMELVKGMPITEHCDRNKLSIRDRLKLFLQVCHAVQHAHQKGIIHRDLKPSNVIVAMHDTLPVVKVIDFGVAKAIGQQLTDNTLYTAFSQMVGTPLYMSPEQAGYSSLDVDTRSDIYALGVLMYELLTGNTPFDRNTLKQAGYDEMRRIIREVDPPRPSARVSTLKAADQSTIAQQHCVERSKFSLLLRGELDWIVMKALEKDRNRRYDTAIGLAADVQRFLADEPVQACPPSFGYRFRKVARKNRVTITTLAVVALTMLAGTGVSVWQAVRATRAEFATNKQRVLAETNAEEARRQSSEAMLAQAEAVKARQEAEAQGNEVERQRQAVSRNLYVADIRLGLVDWNEGNIGRLSSKLIGHEPKLGAEDQRGWEWYYLLASIHEEERTLMQHAAPVDSVSWSPDGQYLAVGTETGTCDVYKASDWSLASQWKAHTGSVWAVTWNPTGAQIATAGADNLIQLWEPNAGNKLQTLRGHVDQVVSLAWESSGSRLASGGQDGLVKIWRLPHTPQSRRLVGHTGGVRAVAWCEDDMTLRSLGAVDGACALWDAVSGQLISNLEFAAVTAGQFSKGGKLLAVDSPDKNQLEILIHDAATGDLLNAVKHETASALDCAFSPDDSKLAILSSENLEILDLQSGLSIYKWLGQANTALSWSPDGGLLAEAGQGDPNAKVGPNRWAAWVHIFDVKSPQFLKIRHGSNWTTATAVSWSPNGQQLVSGDSNGVAEISDLSTGRKVMSAQLHTGKISSLAWSPDARRIASGGTDGTVRIWDPTNGEELLKLDMQLVGVTHVAWSPNGQRLLGTMADGSIHIWDATVGYRYFQGETYACDLLKRRLVDLSKRWEVGKTNEFLLQLNQIVEETEPKVSTFPHWAMSRTYGVATIAASKGQGQDAMRIHNALMRISKDEGKTRHRLALALYDAGQLADAITVFKSLIVDDRDDRLARNNLGISLSSSGRFTEAIEFYKSWVAEEKNDMPALHRLADILANCPDPKLRDPTLAVELAENLCHLMDIEGSTTESRRAATNTLGVAQYRACNWEAAVETLNKSVELGQGGDSYDYFFLAMSHRQLDNKVEARVWYDKANAWMNKNESKNDELIRFRAEAAELLGIEDGKNPKEESPPAPDAN